MKSSSFSNLKTILGGIAVYMVCTGIGLAANGNPMTSGLIFEDNFSSGDLTKYNEYFRWGDGTAPMSSAWNPTVTTTGPLGNQVRAIKYTYGVWQETRFSLMANSSERRASADAPSTVAYPELWIRYDLFIPTNYYHSSAAGQGGSNNDKGWLTIWKDGYADGKMHYRYEWRPTGDGSSYATLCDYVYGGNNANISFARPQDLFQSSGAYAIKTSERGTWVNYTMHVKAPSSATGNDGVAELYKNGQLAFRWANISHWALDNIAEHAGFDRGYLMGYHNSLAPDGGATFYLTNFKIGTTAASVGLNSVSPTPPTSLNIQ